MSGLPPSSSTFQSHSDAATSQSHQSTAANTTTAAAAAVSPSTSAHPAPNKPDPTLSTAQDAATEGRFSAASTAGAAKLADLKVKLKGALRQYHDFPTPGIVFEDIMPIFADAALHESLIRALELQVLSSDAFNHQRPDIIVGLEARGFLFGPSLALRLGAAFVPVRKKGKLPGETVTAGYKKEYGEDFFQVQKDSIKSGQKVLVVDDIIATGGSAMAAGELVAQLGGSLLGYIFMLELDFLKGRNKLNAPVITLLSSQ